MLKKLAKTQSKLAKKNRISDFFHSLNQPHQWDSLINRMIELPCRGPQEREKSIGLYAAGKSRWLRQMYLNFFSRAPLALGIDTRASPKLKIKHKQQNNSLFAIMLLFNNLLLLYSRSVLPLCYEEKPQNLP